LCRKLRCISSDDEDLGPLAVSGFVGARGIKGTATPGATLEILPTNAAIGAPKMNADVFEVTCAL
jgi:hypothetical protein